MESTSDNENTLPSTPPKPMELVDDNDNNKSAANFSTFESGVDEEEQQPCGMGSSSHDGMDIVRPSSAFEQSSCVKPTLGQTLRDDLRNHRLLMGTHQKTSPSHNNDYNNDNNCGAAGEEDGAGNSLRIDEEDEEFEDATVHQSSSSTEIPSALACFFNSVEATESGFNPQESLPPLSTSVNDFATSSVRRRRQRRNPVWNYFDVTGGLAVCRHCSYSTKSVYSTNLKVHLRSHHPKLFEMVIRAESASLLNNTNMLSALKTLKNNAELRGSTVDASVPMFQLLSNLISQTNSETTVNSIQQEGVLKNNNVKEERRNEESKSPLDILDDGDGNNNNIANRLDALRNSSAFASILGNGVFPFSLQQSSSSVMSAALPLKSSNNGVVEATTGGGSAALGEISMDGFFAQQRLENSGGGGGDDLEETNGRQRRKRLRRHPVWHFFRDFENKNVGCVMCNFRTMSAFSTNLKMHLRAHHKEKYLRVLELELQQCNETTATSAAMEEPLVVGECGVGSGGRVKRRRKTAEEIQANIDKCKSTLAKERQKRFSFMSSQRSNSSSLSSSFVSAGSGAALLSPSNGDTQQQPSASTLNFGGSNSAVTYNPTVSSQSLSDTEYMQQWKNLFNSAMGKKLNDDSKPPIQEEPLQQPPQPQQLPQSSQPSPAQQPPKDNFDTLKNLLDQLVAFPQTPMNANLIGNVRQQMRDVALADLRHNLGPLDLLNNQYFKRFVYALAPDYQLSETTLN